MAVSDKFANLKTLYVAIDGLDNSLKVDDPNVLDTVLNAVKDIPKSSYPLEEQKNIIRAIRRSLVVLYGLQASEIGAHIGLDFSNYEIINNAETDEEAAEIAVKSLKIAKQEVEDEEEDEKPARKPGRYMGVAGDDEDSGRDTRGGYLKKLTGNLHIDEDDDYFEEDEEEYPERRSASSIINSMMTTARRRVSDSMDDRKVVTDQRRERNNSDF